MEMLNLTHASIAINKNLVHFVFKLMVDDQLQFSYDVQNKVVDIIVFSLTMFNSIKQTLLKQYPLFNQIYIF